MVGLAQKRQVSKCICDWIRRCRGNPLTDGEEHLAPGPSGVVEASGLEAQAHVVLVGLEEGASC